MQSKIGLYIFNRILGKINVVDNVEILCERLSKMWEGNKRALEIQYNDKGVSNNKQECINVILKAQTISKG